jgi:hypothetical protein
VYVILFVVYVTMFLGRVMAQAADPSDLAVQGVGLRPLGCWGHGFESHSGHRCLSVVLSCVGRGLCDVPRSPTVCLIVCVTTETPKGAPCSKLGTTGKWMNGSGS